MSLTIKVPPASPEMTAHELEASSIVIVGANGAGKTRFGVWLEDNQPRKTAVHRISAQRALNFNEHIAPKPLQQAQGQLQFGWFPPSRRGLTQQQIEEQGRDQKRAHRWGSQPTSHLLSDYDNLLSLLIALDNKRNTDLKDKALTHGIGPADVVKSALDKTISIWEEVMPQRRVMIREDQLLARPYEGDEYAALAMSDGERVAFYLAGQAMCVPSNAVIIVDEPEIHLHRAIQDRLWDAIERERQDCLFIYITHDLAFAASRSNAKHIWIESYDGKSWKWREIRPVEGVPEELANQIRGSRKPALFVEGDSSSLDINLYKRLYPEHIVIPRGSCQSVIESTRIFRNSDQFHDFAIFGIVDRDCRTDDEIKSLESRGIFVTPVAEVENTFLLPQVVVQVATRNHKNADEVIAGITSTTKLELQKDLGRQAGIHARHQIHFRLSRFDDKAHSDKSDFVSGVNDFKNAVDPEQIYDSCLEGLKRLLSEGTLESLLRGFNRKGLLNQVSSQTGLEPSHYISWVFSEIDAANRLGDASITGKMIIDGLRNAFPKIPTSNFLIRN